MIRKSVIFLLLVFVYFKNAVAEDRGLALKFNQPWPILRKHYNNREMMELIAPSLGFKQYKVLNPSDTNHQRNRLCYNRILVKDESKLYRLRTAYDPEKNKIYILNLLEVPLDGSIPLENITPVTTVIQGGGKDDKEDGKGDESKSEEDKSEESKVSPQLWKFIPQQQKLTRWPNHSKKPSIMTPKPKPSFFGFKPKPSSFFGIEETTPAPKCPQQNISFSLVDLCKVIQNMPPKQQQQIAMFVMSKNATSGKPGESSSSKIPNKRPKKPIKIPHQTSSLHSGKVPNRRPGGRPYAGPKPSKKPSKPFSYKPSHVDSHKPAKPSKKPVKPSQKPSKPFSHKPSKPSHKPSKPSHKPSKPSHKPSKPFSHKPSKPSHKPSKPSHKPSKPFSHKPSQAFSHKPSKPSRPTFSHKPSAVFSQILLTTEKPSMGSNANPDSNQPWNSNSQIGSGIVPAFNPDAPGMPMFQQHQIGDAEVITGVISNPVEGVNPEDQDISIVNLVVPKKDKKNGKQFHNNQFNPNQYMDDFYTYY